MQNGCLENVGKKIPKPRYKGFETFLRRIAYNLGNTPSQTEVKIISCIPIDVSDLQHRILVLERKIAEKKKPSKTSPVVNTALYYPQFDGTRTAPVTCNCEELPSHDNKTHEISCSSNVENPKMSQISIRTPITIINKHDKHIEKPTVNNNPIPTQTYDIIQDTCRTKRDILNDPLKTSLCFKHEEGKDAEDKLRLAKRHSKKIQEKKKYSRQGNKLNTQLVYYAQTVNSPFKYMSYTPIESVNKANEYHNMSRAYLEDMIRKQYKPKLRNSTSEFSSPICRDFERCHHYTCSYDSDMCSCCEIFRNVDRVLTAQNRNKIANRDSTISVKNTANDYYNSSYYDVVPVKEKSIKNKHTRKIIKETVDYPERVCLKTRHHHWTGSNQINKSRNLVVKTLKHQFKGTSYSSIKVKRLRNKINAKVGPSVSKNYRGDDLITHKQMRPYIEKHEPLRQIISYKNKANMSQKFNNIQCQTMAHVKETTPVYENKTEATLNQIKTILQTVLKEVKTTSQIKCAPGFEAKPQKVDAVIQKGSSQNAYQNSSRLLQRFTCSPYNINPYMSSYSPQLPSTSLCCPSYPHHHYFQNFPVLIQSPRNVDSSFKQPQVTRSVSTINATDVTTNTRSEDNHNKHEEAYKLIKEIYDSIATDVQKPTKDIPVSNIANNNSSPLDNSHPLKSKMYPVVVTPPISNLPKNEDSTTSLQSKLINDSNDKSRSARVVIDSSRLGKRKEEEKIEEYFDHRNISETKEQNNDQVTLTDPSESWDSDTEIEETPSVAESLKNVQTQEKKGLFNKILNSVKMFKNIEGKKKKLHSVSEESDSTDNNYQNTYDVMMNPKCKLTNSKNSKNSKNQTVLHGLNTKPNEIPVNLKNTPYLDQEYKRRWEEKLMFHNETPCNLSSYERPSATYRGSALPDSKNAVFYRSLDVRTAAVQQRSHQVEHIGNTRIGSVEARKAANIKIGAQRLNWLRKQNRLKLSCVPEWKKLILEG